VAGVIAVGAAVPALSASAAPRLPARSAASLVAAALHPRVHAFSGSVTWSPDLGLPALGGLTSGEGQGVPSGSAMPTATSLLTGAETFQVWVDGANLQRVATSGALSEADLVRRGDQAWTWDSTTQKVVHYLLPAGTRRGAAPGPAALPTPAALADRLLAGLRAHDTAVTVSQPVRVAGVAAYVLSLTPTGAAGAMSTVSAVRIAVDAANGMPLQVSVIAKGQAVPAISLGFRSVSFATPPLSVFSAPQGTTTVTKRLAGAMPGRTRLMTPRVHPSTATRSLGSGWGTVGVLRLPPSAAGARELQQAARAVSGRWGTGRLLSTSLLNVLILPDNTALVGFVTPATLEADAASLAG
jgi:outer membrane lipoprotein-sorting protein